MTQKDFELIARAVKDLPLLNQTAQEYVAQTFAEYLSETNPRFDRDKFLKACGF